jgi:hypothetical protein
MLPQYCESNKFDKLLQKRRKIAISQPPTLKELPSIPHLQDTPEHSSLTELKEHRRIANRKEIVNAYNKWEKDNELQLETAQPISLPAHCTIKEILLRNQKNSKSTNRDIANSPIKCDSPNNHDVVIYS